MIGETGESGADGPEGPKVSLIHRVEPQGNDPF